MDSYEITVTSVTATASESTGKRYFKVEAIDDQGEKIKFNLFDETDADKLHAAQTNRQKVTVTLERNGKWLNFKSINSSITAGDGTEIPPTPPRPQRSYSGGKKEFKSDPAKIASIERQVAAKEAMAYLARVGETGEQLGKRFVEIADFIYAWIHQEN